MNTEPIVFKFGDDKVQLKPEPLLRRFTISLVHTNAAGEKTIQPLGYLGMHNFPSRTPVYLPNECSLELIKTFGDQGISLLTRRCEELIQRNGHAQPHKRP